MSGWGGVATAEGSSANTLLCRRVLLKFFTEKKKCSLKVSHPRTDAG